MRSCYGASLFYIFIAFFESISFLVVSHDSIRGFICPSVCWLVRWSIGNTFAWQAQTRRQFLKSHDSIQYCISVIAVAKCICKFILLGQIDSLTLVSAAGGASLNCFPNQKLTRPDTRLKPFAVFVSAHQKKKLWTD